MNFGGTITFVADDGSEFELPVNPDGTCGPLPRAGTLLRWNPPGRLSRESLPLGKRDEPINPLRFVP